MKVLVTGSAGFIGYHMAMTLLQRGCRVVGVDCLTTYYDVNLKISRQKNLLKYSNYTAHNINIDQIDDILSLTKHFKPNYIIHLAAQAGVRHSIQDPSSYTNTNLVGTFNIMECAKTINCKHLLILF